MCADAAETDDAGNNRNADIPRRKIAAVSDFKHTADEEYTVRRQRHNFNKSAES